ncbi:MAG TPA: hypothetical protein VFV34_17265, partial [Blastocatellia bacterium]|nr:hypothetical protein [Blastocatellia bacterium]
LTLVGHSQGGLVIQGYLANTLEAGQAEKLSQIRQAILMATPNLGSTIFSPLRKFVSVLFPNPQERALRVLNPEIADMRSVVLNRVIQATEGSSKGWPVPIHAFYGLQDNVVVEASAKGDFENTTGVDGDHFSILKPANHADHRYKKFAEAVLEPSGHPHIFEIDLYETLLSVEPLPVTESVPVTHGSTNRTVETDNIATLTRSATFSHKNRCRDLFTIRYSTRSGGFLKAAMSHPNEASPEEKGRYDDYGTEVVFKFTPKEPGKRHTLRIDIYKGFSEGSRDIHFHLRKQSYYKRLRYTLDLSRYVASGYTVVVPPKLYFHPDDPEDHDVCKARGLGDLQPPIAVDPSGIWKWEFEDVRQGVVDFEWDVARPVGPAATAEKEWMSQLSI